MVVVPVGVLPQVGQRGLVDEGGEGEPIFVLLEVGSRRWSEVVDEEGDGREEVDLMMIMMMMMMMTCRLMMISILWKLR